MAGHGNGNRIEMAGKRYGKLTVTESWRLDTKRRAEWLCLCDCGAEKWVNGANLRAGYSKSCGCARTATNKGRAGRHVTPEQAKRIGELWVQQPPLHITAIAEQVGVSTTAVSVVARFELGLPSRVGSGGIGRASPVTSRPRAVKEFPTESVATTDARPVTVRCGDCLAVHESDLLTPRPCPACGHIAHGRAVA